MSREEWVSAEPARLKVVGWTAAGRGCGGAVVVLLAGAVLGCTSRLEDLVVATKVIGQSASATASTLTFPSSTPSSGVSGIVTSLSPLEPGTARPSTELDAGAFARDADSGETISPAAGSALPVLAAATDAGFDAGPASDSRCEAANAPFVYVYAVPATAIQVDGELDTDWSDACWLPLTATGQSTVSGPTTNVALRYSSEMLYVAVRTEDPVHVGPPATAANSDLWKFDDVQLALDDLSKSSGTDPYEYEYGCSLSAADKVVGYRRYPTPASTPELVQTAIRVASGETRYEIAIPRSALGGKDFGPTLALKLDVAVCDGSSSGAASAPWSYRGLAPGLVTDNPKQKSSSAFLQVIWK